MLFNNFLLIDESKIIKKFNYKNFQVIYNGLIFIEDLQEGKESIIFLLEQFLRKGYFNFNQIFGNFFISIYDKLKNESYFFTDNSGMYKIYIYNQIISNSFLKLLSYSKKNNLNLDYEAINEFLHFGFYYFNKSPIKEIRRIDKNVFIYKNDNIFKIMNKNISNINETNYSHQFTFKKFFSIFKKAIIKLKISVDLTGGYDSRLIAAFLKDDDLKLEFSMSGLPNNKDITISNKISKILNKPFYPSIHTIYDLDISIFKKIFLITDSQIDILHFHRLYQFFTQRKKRNIDLHISGVAGELYKEFWWLQDFPFYNKKKANLEKLYNLRIEGKSFPHHILSKKIKQFSYNTKRNTLKKIRNYTLDNNTKTYDNIYYNYKMYANAATYLTITNNYFFKSYAPLMELELVKFGFNLKRIERFFNIFHRINITKMAPEISVIRTTDRTTCSIKFYWILLDSFTYALDKSIRLFKQILQKILNKTFFIESPTNKKFYQIVKALFDNNEIDSYLQKYEILNENFSIKNLNDVLYGRFLTIAFLIKFIENEKSLT